MFSAMRPAAPRNGCSSPEGGGSGAAGAAGLTWAGTGVLWTLSGGVPRSLGIVGEANAQAASGLTFLQISDSHVGFHQPANPNALGTSRIVEVDTAGLTIVITCERSMRNSTSRTAERYSSSLRWSV